MKLLNNIDKDLLNASIHWEELGKELILDNNIKCSKSAMNNLVYFLKRGKNCTLCLGAFKLPNSNSYLPNFVSHVWIVNNDKIYQTHVPDQIRSEDALVSFKCIEFLPIDLVGMYTKIKSSINSLDENLNTRTYCKKGCD